MVIYDIIGLANTPELVRFGLNMTASSLAGSLDNVLSTACEKKIIYLNDTNGCYEFKRSDSKDISGLIRDYKSKPENLPDNYMTALEGILGSSFATKTKKKVKGDPLSPQKYNLLYREDKRLKKILCMLKDAEDPTFFDGIHKEIAEETDYKKSFDGAIVYVVCEKNDEIDKAIALTKNNKHKKVYCFAMVLSHSRYKYVLWQERPFTTDTFIRAHIKAFAFLGGRPKEIVYDQDKILAVSENHGDIIYTAGFQSYLDEVKFSVYLCHGADPESKGPVENVVRFAKKYPQNLFRCVTKPIRCG